MFEMRGIETSDRNKSPDSCYLSLITLISKSIFFDIENWKTYAKLNIDVQILNEY